MPCSSIGEKLPLVTMPTGVSSSEHCAVGARWAPPFGGNAHQETTDTGLTFAVEWLAATELVLRPGHDPPQPGLQGRDPWPELVAVQR